MSCGLLEIVSVLQSIAPLQLAADWDNVGLLIEPEPAAAARINTLLLTIDLTDPVFEEALEQEAELIVAYHPPIFGGLKRLTQKTASERVALGAARRGVFVYSPHTALDAAQDGVNDWLAGAFGAARKRAIEASALSDQEGQGRFVELIEPLRLDAAIAKVKQHLGLGQIRVARPHADANPLLTSVALCAGAGGSILSGVEADLLLTGEMRHHDILAQQARGRSVIVCDHTNTERGYLPVLRARLMRQLPESVRVVAARADRDPLRIV